MRYIAFRMTDWYSIILTIVALGGVKCILIITFLFWGIGLRGLVGSVLALVLGAMFVLSSQHAQISASTENATSQGIVSQNIASRISPAVRDFFRDSMPQVEQKFGKNNAEFVLAVVSDISAGLKAVVIIIPFLLIDLVALFVFRLLDLGVYRIEYLTLPIKVILFLSVDGVSVVARLMVSS